MLFFVHIETALHYTTYDLLTDTGDLICRIFSVLAKLRTQLYLFTRRILSLYVFGTNNGSGVRKAYQRPRIPEITSVKTSVSRSVVIRCGCVTGEYSFQWVMYNGDRSDNKQVTSPHPVPTWHSFHSYGLTDCAMLLYCNLTRGGDMIRLSRLLCGGLVINLNELWTSFTSLVKLSS